jgi:hypothetical protein
MLPPISLAGTIRAWTTERPGAAVLPRHAPFVPIGFLEGAKGVTRTAKPCQELIAPHEACPDRVLREFLQSTLSTERQFERDRLIGYFRPDPSALSAMKPHEPIMLHRLQGPGQIGRPAAGAPGQLLK